MLIDFDRSDWGSEGIDIIFGILHGMFDEKHVKENMEKSLRYDLLPSMETLQHYAETYINEKEVLTGRKSDLKEFTDALRAQFYFSLNFVTNLYVENLDVHSDDDGVFSHFPYAIEARAEMLHHVMKKYEIENLLI